MRAKGMGANVIVTEVLATAALKATLEGMRVMTMEEAAKVGEIFVTATGMKDIIRGEHFVNMKEGAIVCNTGHYDVELNLKELAELSTDARMIREDNREYTLDNGKKVYVLADGRLAGSSLSMDRARVVREALISRGIPRESLRARGYGSSRPVASLTAEDPADRRIEFSVIRMEPLTPTPVDTPGPR